MPSKTVSRRALTAARATLSQTQYNHKRAIIELEQERRAIRAERDAAIIALTLLANHYGINDFTPDQPLADIITSITQVLTASTPASVLTGPTPEPLGLTTIESVGNTYRAICGCGWKSSATPKEVHAQLAATSHEERLHT